MGSGGNMVFLMNMNDLNKTNDLVTLCATKGNRWAYMFVLGYVAGTSLCLMHRASEAQEKMLVDGCIESGLTNYWPSNVGIRCINDGWLVDGEQKG